MRDILISAPSLLIGSLTVLFAVWLLYPACIIAAASAVARTRSRTPGRHPSVTVVIATRDELESVRLRVLNCLQSDWPREDLEVVVGLDCHRRDFPVESLLSLDPRVRTVWSDAGGGKVGALNAAVRAARGEVLVFTDVGQRFAPDAITLLANEVMADSRVGAVSGSLELPASTRNTLAGRYWQFEKRLRFSEARVHSTVGVTGAIYAMRRELWSPLPAGLLLDDLYVPMRLVLRGYRVSFAPRAVAFETRNVGSSQEYRRKVRTLTGNLQLCVWLPGVLIPWRNPIWIQFVFHKLLRLLTPYCLLIMAVAGLAAAAGWLWHHAALIVAASLVGTAVLGLLRPTSVRHVVRVIGEAAVLQAAVLVATLHGIRGKWDVWHA